MWELKDRLSNFWDHINKRPVLAIVVGGVILSGIGWLATVLFPVITKCAVFVCELLNTKVMIRWYVLLILLSISLLNVYKRFYVWVVTQTRKKRKKEFGKVVDNPISQETKPEDNIFSIPFGGEKTYIISHSIGSKLSLKARIEWEKEAGATGIMRVVVNDIPMHERHLSNKNLVSETKGRGRINWFNGDSDSWTLCYSPSFEANSSHERYAVLKDDPYLFVFNLFDVQKCKGRYEVVIKHVGKEDVEQHKKPIIVQDVKIV